MRDPRTLKNEYFSHSSFCYRKKILVFEAKKSNESYPWSQTNNADDDDDDDDDDALSPRHSITLSIQPLELKSTLDT